MFDLSPFGSVVFILAAGVMAICVFLVVMLLWDGLARRCEGCQRTVWPWQHCRYQSGPAEQWWHQECQESFRCE